MPAKEKKFKKPIKPHSLRRMVKKILADADYARFIHCHVLKARKGDAEAARTVRAHFKPERAELSALNLKATYFEEDERCPGTGASVLIDFAAVYHGFLGAKTIVMCSE